MALENLPIVQINFSTGVYPGQKAFTIIDSCGLDVSSKFVFRELGARVVAGKNWPVVSALILARHSQYDWCLKPIGRIGHSLSLVEKRSGYNASLGLGLSRFELRQETDASACVFIEFEAEVWELKNDGTE